MPNKRKAGKRQINSWVQDELADAVQSIAEAKGMKRSQAVEWLLREQVTQYKTRSKHVQDPERKN